MREQDIKALLKDVVGPHLKFQTTNRWVMCKCPLAEWTHEKGSDTRPSFGVHIDDRDTSIFNCFTCGKKGPMSHFVRLIEQYTGKNYARTIRALEKEETYQAELPEWDDCRQLQLYKEPEPLPDHFKDFYDPIKRVPKYLKKRGIRSMEPLLKAQAAIDPDDKGVRRIVFPVMDQEGRLYGYTGRALTSKALLKVRDYPGLPKEHMLLGAHLITNSTKRIVVVEGLIDYLMCIQAGHVAVAVMHSGVTERQADRFADIGKPVCLMFDNDKAGAKATAQAIKALHGLVPITVCVYEKLYEADDLPDKYKLPDDPGSMRQWEIDYLIDKAELA